MNKYHIICILLFCLLTNQSVQAEEEMSLKQIEQIENIEKVVQDIDKLDMSLNELIKQRETHCAKAIGYKPFCGCILKDLPVAWSFSDYIAITTKSKEENQYSKMSKEYQTAYDKVAPIRDMCVRAINKKH